MTITSLAGRRVAAYARFSSSKQNEKSADDQIRELRDYATRHGKVGGLDYELTDEGVSGQALDRPGFNELRRLVAAHAVDVVLVEDLSRISRRMADSAAVLREFEYHDVVVIGVCDGVNTSDPNAMTMAGFHAVMNETYSTQLAYRTRRGMKARARAGKSAGGACFGYMTEPCAEGGKAWVVDPEAAKHVVAIFERYLAGESTRQIAEWLDEQGVRPPRAKHWRRDSVRAMLTNARYRGDWTFGKLKWKKVPGTNKRRPRPGAPNEQVTERRSDLQIVPTELFDAVQVQMRKRRRNNPGTPGDKARRTYPLSGHLRCGGCGSNMIIAGPPGRKCYSCSAVRQNRGSCENRRSIPEADLRALVARGISSRLGTPSAVAYVAELVAQEAEEGRGARGDKTKTLRRRLKKAETEVANMVEAIKRGAFSAALSAELQRAEADVARLQRELDTASKATRTPRALDQKKLVRDVLRVTKALDSTPKEARDALGHLLQGGSFTLTPQQDGRVQITADLFPLGLTLCSPKGNAGSRSEPALPTGGCGGRI